MAGCGCAGPRRDEDKYSGIDYTIGTGKWETTCVKFKADCFGAKFVGEHVMVLAEATGMKWR